MWRVFIGPLFFLRSPMQTLRRRLRKVKIAVSSALRMRRRALPPTSREPVAISVLEDRVMRIDAIRSEIKTRVAIGNAERLSSETPKRRPRQ